MDLGEVAGGAVSPVVRESAITLYRNLVSEGQIELLTRESVQNAARFFYDIGFGAYAQEILSHKSYLGKLEANQ